MTSLNSSACFIALLKSRENLMHAATKSNFFSWGHRHSEESNTTVLNCSRVFLRNPVLDHISICLVYRKNNIKKFLNLYGGKLKQALGEVISETSLFKK